MRDDLLALTPEKVAALANVGLVKRAQKDLAAGQGPAIEEREDGTVVGRFADGTIAQLPRGKSLRDSPCSCPSTAVCRHRVTLALAYVAWARERQPAGATPAPARSPSAITDDELLAALGRRSLERARLALRDALLVEVVPGGDGEVPTARLPTCTVRFLSGAELTHAHCDCRAGGGCEHIALACWAFREAHGRAVVQLGSGSTGAATEPLDEVVAFARELVVEGVVHVSAALAPRFAQVRARLQGAGMIWPVDALDALEEQLAAYRERHAAYHPDQVASLLAELHARRRAATGASELPPAAVLGSDEALETTLDHVRLVSLGARVFGDEQGRHVEVYLADPDTATVLVLEKRWTYGEGERPDPGPALATRSIGPHIQLGVLAHGALVSKGVRRKANRRITLSTSRMQPSSVSRQSGDWSAIPEPLRVASVPALIAQLRARAPSALRPRYAAEDLHVVPIASVGSLRYAPGEQELHAMIAAPGGGEVAIVCQHRAAAPGALDAVAAALGSGRAKFVAGVARATAAGVQLDPTALITDQMIVPDLEGAAGAVADVALRALDPPTPLAGAVASAQTVLATGVHQGLLRAAPSWADEVAGSADALRAHGLAVAADRMKALQQALIALRMHGTSEAKGIAARRWLDASLRIQLTAERL